MGLTFDAATRTISGTPLAVTPVTEHLYIVTDGANARASLPFSIEVVLPPLEAVPSLRVLDAPSDQGSRIVLTWTLSPSDRLLQGVVAGAVGPAEPVVGVYGYNIYRRAVGEDEFVLIAQVDAGVTSFVDETARSMACATPIRCGPTIWPTRRVPTLSRRRWLCATSR